MASRARRSRAMSSGSTTGPSIPPLGGRCPPRTPRHCPPLGGRCPPRTPRHCPPLGGRCPPRTPRYCPPLGGRCPPRTPRYCPPLGGLGVLRAEDSVLPPRGRPGRGGNCRRPGLGRRHDDHV